MTPLRRLILVLYCVVVASLLVRVPWCVPIRDRTLVLRYSYHWFWTPPSIPQPDAWVFHSVGLARWHTKTKYEIEPPKVKWDSEPLRPTIRVPVEELQPAGAWVVDPNVALFFRVDYERLTFSLLAISFLFTAAWIMAPLLKRP